MEQLSLLEETAGDRSVPRGQKIVDPVETDQELTTLAAGLNTRLRLGTSSWSFPGWAGLVYASTTAKQTLSRDGLTAYSRHPLLRTVGVDSGFYAPLDARRLACYAEQVPPDFRFLVKAPASITDRLGRTVDRRTDGRIPGAVTQPNPGFLDPELALEQAVLPYCEGLGDRAGVLLFQFPPLGPGITGHPRRFAEDLYRFLHRLPKGPIYAVELRDDALLTLDLAAALHHGGAVPALAGHPQLPLLDAQGALFGEHNDGPLVIRWLLRRNRRYDEARQRYQPFDRLEEPDPPTRQQVARLVGDALSQGREVFVIVNNKAEGSSPLTLIELARLLANQTGDDGMSSGV
ncbi:MAG: DUF72 domain-containing protein [Thiohalocapsa sp.]